MYKYSLDTKDYTTRAVFKIDPTDGSVYGGHQPETKRSHKVSLNRSTQLFIYGQQVSPMAKGQAGHSMTVLPGPFLPR
jgi:hypothetical protein